MARHIRDKTMLKQRAQPAKHTRAPPAHMQTPPEEVPTLGTNRSGRFSKPVRPVKTGQTALV
jgi:hypothetical protein